MKDEQYQELLRVRAEDPGAVAARAEQGPRRPLLGSRRSADDHCRRSSRPTNSAGR